MRRQLNQKGPFAMCVEKASNCRFTVKCTIGEILGPELKQFRQEFYKIQH